MRNAFVRFICRILIASLTTLSIGTASAGMIPVDQAGAVTAPDRAAVMDFLARDEVAGALQARGVEPQLARERVAAMTDPEVAALKEKIDTLPAGAFMSGGEVAAGALALAALIALIIWAIYNAFKK